MEVSKLLQSDLQVINIGLKEFARDLEQCHVPVVHVVWSPPPIITAKLATLLSKLGG